MGSGMGRFARAGVGAAAFPVLLAAMTAPALASGNTSEASGEVRATVVAPLAAAEIADLDFGEIASNRAQGGAVSVPAGSDRAHYAGGARSSCNAPHCPAAHPARFAVSGEANRAYAVWTPASMPVEGLLPSGASARVLTVSGIEVRTDSRPQSGPHGQLDTTGADGFGIGGTLQVPAGLPAAHYRVSIPVMLTYG